MLIRSRHPGHEARDTFVNYTGWLLVFAAAFMIWSAR